MTPDFLDFEKPNDFSVLEKPLLPLDDLFQKVCVCLGGEFEKNYHGLPSRRVNWTENGVRKSILISPVTVPEKYPLGPQGMTYLLSGLAWNDGSERRRLWSETFEVWKIMPSAEVVETAISKGLETLHEVQFEHLK